MKKIFPFIGLLILSNAYADIPTEEFAECSIIKTPTIKIQCFDNLAEKYNVNRIEFSEDETQDLGDWVYDFYVDDFGDKTDNGFIALTGIGTQSWNSRMELHIRFFLDEGSLENPWFRMYVGAMRASNLPLDNDGSQVRYASCQFKDSNGTVFEDRIYQSPGADSYRIAGEETRKEFADLISNEGSLKAACADHYISGRNWNFELNFRNFSKALYAFENQP